MGAQLFTI